MHRAPLDRPKRYTHRRSSETHEAETAANNEAKKRQKAQEEAAKRQEIAADETDALRLDALWEDMDDAERDSIEIETRDHLGVLFQGGKNSAAFAAMRRNVQRERLSNTSSTQQHPVQEA